MSAGRSRSTRWLLIGGGIVAAIAAVVVLRRRSSNGTETRRDDWSVATSGDGRTAGVREREPVTTGV